MSGVRIAVVDSGWDAAAGDPRVLPGRSFVPGEEAGDALGHGTACIGEVLRWAPEARVLPVRVFGDEPETSPEALCEAIRWAAGAGAGVINLSLGTAREDARAMLAEACAAAAAAGAVLVSAGPNAGDPTYPAAFPGVVGVWPGAAAPGEIRIRDLATLDVVAYTGERPVHAAAGGSGSGTGTSLAAAEVAGRIAALRAAGFRGPPAALLRRLAAGG